MNDDSKDRPGATPPASGSGDPHTNGLSRSRHWPPRDSQPGAQTTGTPPAHAPPAGGGGQPGPPPPEIPEIVPVHLVPPPGSSGFPIGKFLLMVLVALTAWNVYGSTRPAVLTSREGEQMAARVQLYLLAQDIEAHRLNRGRLPTSLVQVGELGEDVVFTPKPDGSYTLATQVSGARVLYTPGTEDRLYQDMVGRIVRGEEG